MMTAEPLRVDFFGDDLMADGGRSGRGGVVGIWRKGKRGKGFMGARKRCQKEEGKHYWRSKKKKRKMMSMQSFGSKRGNDCIEAEKRSFRIDSIKQKWLASGASRTTFSSLRSLDLTSRRWFPVFHSR